MRPFKPFGLNISNTERAVFKVRLAFLMPNVCDNEKFSDELLRMVERYCSAACYDIVEVVPLADGSEYKPFAAITYKTGRYVLLRVTLGPDWGGGKLELHCRLF